VKISLVFTYRQGCQHQSFCYKNTYFVFSLKYTLGVLLNADCQNKGSKLSAHT